MLTSRIEGAQKKVEEFHFVNRKNVVKYDDVLNEQREQVYATRREILEGEDLHEMVVGWFEDVIEAAVDAPRRGRVRRGLGLGGHVGRAPVDLPDPRRLARRSTARSITREELLDRIFDDAISAYEEREKEWGEELTRNLERWVALQVLDVRWREHLDNMDYMRQGIGLRGYAQKDPLVEYRAEGAGMFNEMDFLVKQETVRALMHVEVAIEDEAQYDHRPTTAPSSAPTSTTPPRRSRRWPPPGAQTATTRTTRSSRSSSSATSTPTATSAATTRAGAARARSSRSAMAHNGHAHRAAFAGRAARGGRGDQSPAALGS